MRKIEDNINISQQLVRYLKDELSETEKTEVDKLLDNDIELNNLFNKLKQEDYLEKQIQRHRSINLDEKWNHQIGKIRQSNFRKRFFYFSKIAAAIIIPCLIATYLIFTTQSDFNDTKEEFALKAIPIGNKAQIITEQGNTYDLDGENITIRNKSAKINQIGKKLVYAKQVRILTNKTEIEYHTLIVPKGQNRSLILSDGTQVLVNAESKIKYPVDFIGHERRVEVLKGEAYFNVAENKNKPFIVNTARGSEIKVLGTSFNVRAYGDDGADVTTLVEGSVSLKHKFNPDSEIELEPGQQATLKSVNHRINVQNADMEAALAWTKRKFIFKSKSLEEIFKHLNRWYDFNVEYQNKNIMQKKFRANVDIDKGVIFILDLLEKTERVYFEYKGNTIRVKDM